MKRTLPIVIGLAALTWAAPSTTSQKPPVQVGIDVLESQGFATLKGKQIGLITNQTGVNSEGRSTADLLARAPGVKLVAIFSPEHGIRGTRSHGEIVGDTIDPKLKLPVYSLYGELRKPSKSMLNAIEVLVFDMQDVGARFYTYLTTMGMAMEAASERGISFVVLDRPNPAGGVLYEGQVLNPKYRHFTAYFEVPVRHGFTAGELAMWYKETQRLPGPLSVIPIKNWTRQTLWPETQLRFIPPSPNIRNPTAALLYSGVGMFEATNVAVGRGTETPFEIFGAPWMDGKIIAKRLSDLALPGLEFLPEDFTPTSDLYKGELCSGVRIKVKEPTRVRTVELFVHVACLIREYWPKEFQPRWEEVARVSGSQDFEDLYNQNKSASDILDVFRKSTEEFEKTRQPFLLY